MATQLKKVVAPSGGDYTSLSACISAQAQNLVTADKYFDVEISGSWSSADTSAVSITGYTTDATRYINIYTTGDARHQGVYSTSAYRLELTNGGISVQAGQVTIDGLQQSLTHTNQFASQDAVFFSTSYSPYTYKNNILKLVSSTSYNGQVTGVNASLASGGPRTLTAHNNIIYGFKKPAGGVAAFFGLRALVDSYRTGTNYIYNNTVYDCDTGIESTKGTTNATNNLYLKNNISVSCVVADFVITNSPTTDVSNNLSSDATAPGASSLTSRTAANQFESAGSDFHLKAGADAIDAGADLGSSYNTDIIGTSRPQGSAWDIGAFEYIQSVASTIKRRMLMGAGV